MSPGQIRPEIVAERAARVRDMLAALRGLPLASWEEFAADTRNAAAAESYLRRSLEALLDIGRHLLAKGFGRATTEYKEIARALQEVGVLDQPAAKRLTEMAGFRNRLVHFYGEVADAELYDICTRDVRDVEAVLESLLKWTRGRAVEAGADATGPATTPRRPREAEKRRDR